MIYDNSLAGISYDQADSGADADISNNTIVDNTFYGVRGPSSLTVANCIVWGNYIELNGPSATYSCIEDWTGGGTGNIQSYPYFADYANDDFHLTWNSPCINRGDPNGSYAGQTDIDGDDRVADEDFIDARVDIGADEMTLDLANLVKNPGFELGGGGLDYDKNEDPCVPLYWWDCNYQPSVSKSIDSAEKHSEDYSWKFVADGTVHTLSRSDSISLVRDNIYRLSAWLKSEDANELVSLGWHEFDAGGSYLRTAAIMDRETIPTEWTAFQGYYSVRGDDVSYVTVALCGPTKLSDYEDGPAGTIWWDDLSLVEVGTEFLPPYGCESEPNVAKSIDFGASDDDVPSQQDGIAWSPSSSMGDRCTDSNDGNITYREALKYKYRGDNNALKIQFPAFNVDANGFPLTPMLLEIMYKDTIEVAQYDEDGQPKTGSYDQIFVYSKIDYLNLDPNYLRDPNNRDSRIAHIGGFEDDNWKYIQYGFQKSDFQLLRAIDGKFTIKIETRHIGAIPIDYVSLRKITQTEYEALVNKQREVRNFDEVDLPTDSPSPPVSYDDPNITIFARDIMRPVYRHTKPDSNEIDPNIVGFGAWGETEPVSFSVYSENGVSGLTVSVSNLTHSQDSNDIINANDISIYRVIYDESRLGYTLAWKITRLGYALKPDRLEQFTSLSVDAGTSERIWLKIQVPEANDGLSAGLYEANVYIKKNGITQKTVPLKFTVYNITLDLPGHTNVVSNDPYWGRYSNNLSTTFQAYRETGFDPFIRLYSHCITFAPQDPNDSAPIEPNNLVFDSNLFEESLDRMIEEGFAKDKVSVWIEDWYMDDLYNLVMPSTYNKSDPNLYYNLSDANFVAGFSRLVDKYIEVGNDNNITLIFFVVDEPSNNPYRRILADRLYTIIRDPNGPDGLTSVTYYNNCDSALDPGEYNTPNDMDIPALTNLVDYKVWNMAYQDDGYTKSQDPNYHGYYGYYTTCHSHYRNPVYNRFLHGLFAFRTEPTLVWAYAMGDYSGDMYNDLDADGTRIYPHTFPDFLFAYPTWSGELLYTMGGLEGIREGIKDAKYIATLKRIIEEYPNDPDSDDANDFLDDLYDSIDPNYVNAYSRQATDLGYYPAILQDISGSSDPDDFEAFTEIRKTIADYIVAIDPNS